MTDDRPPAGPRDAVPASDLAEALAHYPLGAVRSIRPIRRGSADTPKYVVDSERGEFVIKRRRERPAEIAFVGFTHAVQTHVAEAGFPTPALVTTTEHHSTAVVHEGLLYEVQRFVRGGRYDHSEAHTASAGAALARFHALTEGFRPGFESPRGTFHRAPAVAGHLEALARSAGADLAKPVASLAEAYRDAADRVDRAGVFSGTERVVHADWHPGNLLFEGPRVSAVLDYDTARLAPRALDLAIGLLQFSITREHDDPRTWPDHVDHHRFRAFLGGYAGAYDRPLERPAADALPWLMIESIVSESVGPVATTGRFAAIEGNAFLRMVDRKVRWLASNAETLAREVR